jgi:hypothetical protein
LNIRTNPAAPDSSRTQLPKQSNPTFSSSSLSSSQRIKKREGTKRKDDDEEEDSGDAALWAFDEEDDI